MNTREEYGEYVTFGKLVDGTLTELIDDSITQLNDFQLGNLPNLTSLSLPNLTNLNGSYILQYSGVERIIFDKITNIPNQGLAHNSATYIDVSSATNIGQQAFSYNVDNNTLETIILSENPIKVGNSAISYLKKLKNLVNFGSIKQLGNNSLYNSSLPEELYNELITNIPDCCFEHVTGLKTISLPSVTSFAGRYNFAESSIVSINLPSLTTTGNNGLAFYKCVSLNSVNAPLLATMHNGDFQYCTSLLKIDLPSLNSIPNDAFSRCDNMQALILRKNSVVSLYSMWALPNKNERIYVPDELVDTYKNATNWSSIANKIKPISSLPT